MFTYFDPEQVLLDYDSFPTLCTIRDDTGDLFLCQLAKNTDKDHVFLVVPITDKEVSDLKKRKRFVRDIFLGKDASFIKVPIRWEVRSVERLEHLPTEYLPEPGLFLYPGDNE